MFPLKEFDSGISFTVSVQTLLIWPSGGFMNKFYRYLVLGYPFSLWSTHAYFWEPVIFLVNPCILLGRVVILSKKFILLKLVSLWKNEFTSEGNSYPFFNTVYPFEDFIILLVTPIPFWGKYFSWISQEKCFSWRFVILLLRLFFFIPKQSLLTVKPLSFWYPTNPSFVPIYSWNLYIFMVDLF